MLSFVFSFFPRSPLYFYLVLCTLTELSLHTGICSSSLAIIGTRAMDTANGDIYTGPWINFSHGLIRGATLTLGARNAGLLTSFIAAFITVVAARLWSILSFILHQLLSSKEPRDGLHHQQRVVLRNNSSALGASYIFFQQWWAWRHKAPRAFLRTVPFALLGTLYVLAFAFLSVFSSEVSKFPGDARLLRPGNCGYFRMRGDAITPATQQAYTWKTLNDSITAAGYARQCYGGLTGRLECSTMFRPSLPTITNSNATCPFASGMCVYGDTAAFSVDSGLIDSRDDLGINSPDSGRVKFRRVTTCAPVRTKDFLVVTNYTDTNSLLLSYYFGPWNDVGTEMQNMTFSYNTAGK